jgi:hypothetical protein
MIGSVAPKDYSNGSSITGQTDHGLCHHDPYQFELRTALDVIGLDSSGLAAKLAARVKINECAYLHLIEVEFDGVCATWVWIKLAV